MRKQNQKSGEDSSLRQKAEEKIEKQAAAKGKILNAPAEQERSEAEMRKLIHELEVYQIELEMQNKELQLAKEEAKLLAEKFTSIYDFSPTGYFTIDPHGKISRLNLSGAEMLGKERKKLVKSNFILLVSHETLPVMTKFLTNTFETGSKQTCEIGLTIEGRPPSFLYLEGIVSEDKQECLLSAFDITERKRAEETIQKSKDVLSLLMKYTPVYTFIKEVTATESRVVQASENFIQMIGIPGSEMIGKTMNEIFPAEFAAKMTIDDWAIFSSDKIFNEEEELGERSYRTIKFPISHGAKNLLAGYTIDITDQKQAERELRESEARFRSTFDQSPVGSVMTGLDLHLIRCNAAFCHFLGYSENELIGRPISEITLPEDLDLGQIELKEVLEGKRETNRFQKRYIRKDGQIVWGEISICVVRDADNNPIHYLPIIQDITLRKLAEQALAENEIRLRELNATKDKFFSIIAHDLKSPFNGILGFSNILVGQVEEKNYEGIEEYAQIIQNSSQRAMALLMNLLDWSRSQTGRMEFSPEHIEMLALINEITELLSDSAQQKTIQISRKLPRNVLAFADKDMVCTILRNLISNAIKFTHPGGQVVISAELKPDEILFSVADTGIGIKEEAIGKLFRIEANSSTKGTNNESGTGLGLILCKEFVEKHGGRIWVESEVGKGSTFCFTIPKA
jgi:two-component system sensor histidine kinase/response regulator